ncbi:MAG TPA: ATP-binding protein, partial [Actinopolymorphaceae bacterium]
QAAQVVADRDPVAVLAALKRIEEAGLQALAAMDRTVHMLRDTDRDTGPGSPGEEHGAATRAPVQGVPDLPEVVERFAASGTAAARLEIDPAIEDRLTREASATAYRIVVEALTNVRRHAPTARGVDVALTLEDAGVGVTITNDAGSGHGAPVIGLDSAHRRGGLGLVGLAERVDALGGTLRAGPYGDTGWQVHAHLPLPDPSTPSTGTRPADPRGG